MSNEDTARIIARLQQRDPMPPLVPQTVFDPALTAQIEASDAPALVKACLHLWNDDLPRSHALVQVMEGDSTADYWHAIIHRREGEWSNSQYWFRRIGIHPVLTELYGADPNAPAAFVTRCRAVNQGRDTELETMQLQEMTALLMYSQ